MPLGMPLTLLTHLSHTSGALCAAAGRAKPDAAIAAATKYADFMTFPFDL
jgi:hypothetical protein